jgi:hypothetical protein
MCQDIRPNQRRAAIDLDGLQATLFKVDGILGRVCRGGEVGIVGPVRIGPRRTPGKDDRAFGADGGLAIVEIRIADCVEIDGLRVGPGPIGQRSLLGGIGVAHGPPARGRHLVQHGLVVGGGRPVDPSHARGGRRSKGVHRPVLGGHRPGLVCVAGDAPELLVLGGIRTRASRGGRTDEIQAVGGPAEDQDERSRRSDGARDISQDHASGIQAPPQSCPGRLIGRDGGINSRLGGAPQIVHCAAAVPEGDLRGRAGQPRGNHDRDDDPRAPGKEIGLEGFRRRCPGCWDQHLRLFGFRGLRPQEGVPGEQDTHPKGDGERGAVTQHAPQRAGSGQPQAKRGAGLTHEIAS